MAKRIGKTGKTGKRVETFRHPKAKLILRPEVGVQAQFKKKKPAREYRFDSSLAPDLNWDGQNPAREYGQWLLTVIEKAAALPPPTISLGLTMDEVKAIQGEPQTIVDLGSKKIYVYKDLKITFTDGRVSDVQ